MAVVIERLNRHCHCDETHPQGFLSSSCRSSRWPGVCCSCALLSSELQGAGLCPAPCLLTLTPIIPTPCPTHGTFQGAGPWDCLSGASPAPPHHCKPRRPWPRRGGRLMSVCRRGHLNSERAGAFSEPWPGAHMALWPEWLCTDIQTVLEEAGPGERAAPSAQLSPGRELWVSPREDVPLCHPCSGPKRLVSPSPFFPGLFSGGFQKVRGSWRSPGSAMEPRTSCSDPDRQGAARDARVCSTAPLLWEPSCARRSRIRAYSRSHVHVHTLAPLCYFCKEPVIQAGCFCFKDKEMVALGG